MMKQLLSDYKTLLHKTQYVLSLCSNWQIKQRSLPKAMTTDDHFLLPEKKEMKKEKRHYNIQKAISTDHYTQTTHGSPRIHVRGGPHQTNLFKPHFTCWFFHFCLVIIFHLQEIKPIYYQHVLQSHTS